MAGQYWSGVVRCAAVPGAGPRSEAKDARDGAVCEPRGDVPLAGVECGCGWGGEDQLVADVQGGKVKRLRPLRQGECPGVRYVVALRLYKPFAVAMGGLEREREDIYSVVVSFPIKRQASIAF